MDNLNYCNEFEESFKEHSHYSKHQQMIPWVGYNYKKIKVLIIGESHYLPEKSSIHLDSEKWYASSYSDLSIDEKSWTNTAGIISYRIESAKTPKGHTIYLNLEQAIHELGFYPQSNVFEYLSFYNFFQRPAIYKQSLDFDNTDVQISIEVFKHVLQILEPKVICFVSKKPWEVCKKSEVVIWNGEINRYVTFDNITPVDYFPHPASQWWNRQSDQYQLFNDGIKRTGKQKFIDFLKKQNIFSNINT